MPRSLVFLALLQSALFLTVLLATPVVSRLTRQPPAVVDTRPAAAAETKALPIPSQPAAFAEWAKTLGSGSGTRGVGLRADLAAQVLAWINKQREAQRLPALARQNSLDQTAMTHAVDMAANDYLDEIAPNLWRAGERVAALDRTLVADVAEAMARQAKERGSKSPAEALGAQMLATVQGRQALLNRNASTVGVSVAETGFDFVVSVVTAAPVATLSPPLNFSASPGQRLPLSATAASSVAQPEKCSFHALASLNDTEAAPLAGCAAPMEPGIHRLRLHWKDGERTLFGPMIEVR